MDGDEHIGVVAVGDGGTLAQFDELVGLASVNHLHVGQVLLNVGTQLERDGKVEFLLRRFATQGTCVTAAVTRIDDHGLNLFSFLGHDAQRHQKNHGQNTKLENLSLYHIEFLINVREEKLSLQPILSDKYNCFCLDETHNIYEIFSSGSLFLACRDGFVVRRVQAIGSY